jgi:nucleoid-associated protein YgaU
MTRLSKLFAIAVLVSTGTLAFAQHSLYDNPNYKRSQELRRQADIAFAQGEYLKAEEYSRESERLSALSREEAETQLLQWVANSWKNRAADRIAFGEKNGAAGALGAGWTEAKASFAVAVREYDAKRYAESTTASKSVLDLMKDFDPSKLPAFYTVRLIPDARDCFWRIAGYSFIYGDPWKWRVIYEANKNKIPQPDNPDLIVPGIVLTIPSISGEARSGTWSGK